MKKALSALLAIGIIMFVVVLLSSRREDPTTKKESNSGNTQKTSLKGENFEYLNPGTLPSSWEQSERAERAVQALGENQRIEFGIVRDPNQKNIVYFATSEKGETAAGKISIYRYDEEAYVFERIYRTDFASETYGIPGGVAVRAHVLGYDNGKLVVLIQPADDSPGPCTEPLLLGDPRRNDNLRSMRSLDITNPYAKGFEPYVIPEELYEQKVQEEERCLESL